MASLYLPAPTRTGSGPTGAGGKRQQQQGTTAPASASASSSASAQTQPQQLPGRTRVPTYEERCDRAAEMARLPPAQRRARRKAEGGGAGGGGGAALFVPRSLGDFDDGGAFPEIHVAQYPRHMGNPHLAKRRAGGAANGGGAGGGGGEGTAPHAAAANASAPSGRVSASTALVNVQIDSTGDISYDAIVTGGTNADKKVYARHSDLRGHTPTQDDVALPTDDEERATAQRTMAALGVITSKNTEMAKPTGSAMVRAATSRNMEAKTQFIKYTPREDAPGYNPAAKQRVIQMVPAQLDPMQPPKHQHRKAPRGPADDPVPVLHAPPEKLSKEEQEAWNVPACISNWKNTRGYTIPLDKRLAADGRGVRDDATINPNFATLSESLYVAERQAREEVRMRAQVQKRLAVQEKERREEELRELAVKARRERAGQVAEAAQESARQAEEVAGGGGIGGGVGGGIGGIGGGRNVVPEEDVDGPPPPPPPAARPSGPTDDEVAAQQRERLRQERRRERERELRMEHHRGGGGGAKTTGEEHDDINDDDNVAVKKRRLEDDRDISEKVALGTHTGTGGAGEVDSRLYNQSAGMDSGFGAEDDYNVYSKPMFDRDGVSSSSIYRPTRGEQSMDADAQYDQLKAGGITGKFKPDRAFGGADGGGASSAGPRNAPVQFEKGGEK